ncbi:hypothetical protein [Okeania sp. SIO1I7]|nr:hypothetical protein [Okeania sp. SIO1I7]NET25919.1 hypothetical protein [Okeania sp. SIO1I7]
MENISARGRSQSTPNPSGGGEVRSQEKRGNLEEVEVRIIPQFFCP